MQAGRLQELLEEQSPEFLETYRVPLLTWEEAQALKATSAPALEAAAAGVLCIPWQPAKTASEQSLLLLLLLLLSTALAGLPVPCRTACIAALCSLPCKHIACMSAYCHHADADKRALDSSRLAAIAEEPASSNLQRPADDGESEEDLDDIQLAD